MLRWGDGETRRWGDAAMGRRGDGENRPLAPSPPRRVALTRTFDFRLRLGGFGRLTTRFLAAGDEHSHDHPHAVAATALTTAERGLGSQIADNRFADSRPLFRFRVSALRFPTSDFRLSTSVLRIATSAIDNRQSTIDNPHQLFAVTRMLSTNTRTCSAARNRRCPVHPACVPASA